ncbi:MAG: MBL fold metallo-hydrolase [Dehalococcoidia bacterium]|jgi:7,8-dihydropterin-6-yl-methyl-4-(beta-D-ribofuranosyl)aminobenzene 5'-phosphate synthase
MAITVTTLVENTSGVPTLYGEWGQSLLVEADGLKILFDTGPSGHILDNARTLGIDLSTVHKIVISHGHYDHTGGLKDVLALIQSSGNRPDGIEIIAHPDIFQEKHFYLKGLPAKYIGMPGTRAELEALGARFNLSRDPVRITDSIMTTGEVDVSVDYEHIDSTLHTKEEEDYVPDILSDDLSLIIKTEKGLIILLGCGHRGLINTILHARKITGVGQIYAVIGGTHLVSASKTQMDETVNALRSFKIAKLGVSHCTGLKSGAILANEFSEAFFFNSAGTKTLL